MDSIRIEKKQLISYYQFFLSIIFYNMILSYMTLKLILIKVRKNYITQIFIKDLSNVL